MPSPRRDEFASTPLAAKTHRGLSFSHAHVIIRENKSAPCRQTMTGFRSNTRTCDTQFLEMCSRAD